MRINLTKKDIINSIYMKLGFSKKVLDTILDDILYTIIENLKKNKKVKISNFGTFELRKKKGKRRKKPKNKRKKIYIR